MTTEEKPTAEQSPDPLEDRKTIAPKEMANGFSAQEAARLWGTWSDGRAFDGQRRKYPYSIMGNS